MYNSTQSLPVDCTSLIHNVLPRGTVAQPHNVAVKNMVDRRIQRVRFTLVPPLNKMINSLYQISHIKSIGCHVLSNRKNYEMWLTNDRDMV